MLFWRFPGQFAGTQETPQEYDEEGGVRIKKRRRKGV
jgi:hypothetical protein